nr:hypothetical protein [Halomonas borealis]
MALTLRAARDVRHGPGTIVLSDGLGGGIGTEQGGRFRCAIRLEYTNHQVTDLNPATLDPGAGIFPELAAIGAVRIAEGIHDSFGIRVTFPDPVLVGHLLPKLGILRPIDQPLQGIGRDIIALLIDQGTHHGMLSVRCQISRDGLATGAGSIALEPTRRLELPMERKALLLQCLHGAG